MKKKNKPTIEELKKAVDDTVFGKENPRIVIWTSEEGKTYIQKCIREEFEKANGKELK
jgi:hypothetical protein